MKKRKLIFSIFTAVVIFSTSCKKDVSSANIPDSWYQTQLESMLNLHNATQPDHPVTVISNVNFASYKEAYETFKSLSTSQVTPDDQPINQNEPSTLEGYDDLGNGDEILATYFAYCNYSMPIKSSLDPGSIGLSFKIQYVIEWTSSSEAFVEENSSPSFVQVSYSGIGTIKSPSNGQPSVTLTGNSPYSTGGTIQGQVQITGTIKGTAFSVFVTISGSYSYTIPTQFLGTSTVTYGATATGSF